MQTLKELIAQEVFSSLKRLSIPTSDFNSQIIQTSKKNHDCDFQTNIALILAKKHNSNPREFAQKILDNLEKKSYNIFSSTEIAGPGFINFNLTEGFIVQRLKTIQNSPNLAIPKVPKKQKVIVDFSGPNIAKEMHVGHLRSTIIGDSIARILEFAGYEVLRINHIGDWGTQFGMLLALICRKYPNILTEKQEFILSDLENFYREAKILFNQDDSFIHEARELVKKLQAQDPKIINLWKQFCQKSLTHCQEIYDILDIKIQTQGESFYNYMLADIVAELKKFSLAVETQGAIGVFSNDVTDKEGNLVPCIVQKSDGAYVYATTDLAALKYRSQELNADRIIYVTDSRQTLHFKQISSIAKKMNWLQDSAQMLHIPFGMMLGKDKKPIKTRSGKNIKLKDLLEEAQKRSLQLIQKLSPDFPLNEQKHIAKVAGIGGVKYSDLIHSINTDYCFDWDKVLTTDGNSAIYLLINYARTHSVARKLGINYSKLENSFQLKEKSEIQLAKKIILLQDIWEECLKNLSPNTLLNHIYELTRAFSNFWNNCPITKVDKQLQLSRLNLCLCVQKQISWGLSLIGIEALERV